MNIEQMKVGFMDVFCYIITVPDSNDALVIDPAGDEECVVDRVQQMGMNLKYILNTHGHPDHTCGNARIKELTGAKILMHQMDDELFNSLEGQTMFREWGFQASPPADFTLKDGDDVVLGSLALKVLHTPGHSPGGICILGEGNLFTGDTLFVGAVGRTDLPGASARQFMTSIREKILTLPGETIVWPGHDYGYRPYSTIEVEKRENPYLVPGSFF